MKLLTISDKCALNFDNLVTKLNSTFFSFFSQASSHLWKLVDANQPEDKLLRVVTCLANIVCNSSIGIGVRRQAPTPTSDKTTFLNGASAGGTSLISQQYVKFVFIFSSITLILNLWNLIQINIQCFNSSHEHKFFEILFSETFRI